MIVVTGATGHLGKAIVRNLIGRVPADDIVASVRDASKAGDLAASGVAVRVGDFNDADSLRTAFDGADQVLIISADNRADGWRAPRALYQPCGRARRLAFPTRRSARRNRGGPCGEWHAVHVASSWLLCRELPPYDR